MESLREAYEKPVLIKHERLVDLTRSPLYIVRDEASGSGA